MATYPALVQLARLLGRSETLAALGAEVEPDPAGLLPEQRRRLSALIDAGMERVAARLAQEAAASDDVAGAAAARAFVADRIAELGDLLSPAQATRLQAAAGAIAADWD